VEVSHPLDAEAAAALSLSAQVAPLHDRHREVVSDGRSREEVAVALAFAEGVEVDVTCSAARERLAASRPKERAEA
jgi:hypothetical protein